MEMKLYFFVIFIITIFITRIFLYILPIPSPTINNFRFHHYMYGLLLAPIGILLRNITIYAIGVGLVVDELGYLLIGGKTHKDNYSKSSVSILYIFVILIYLFKEKLLFFL